VSRIEAHRCSVEDFRSVTFMPLSKAPAPTPPRTADFQSIPIVGQMIAELSEPLAELARRIQRVGAVSGGTVVLVTGCRRGVGCTTVAVALAAVAASERQVLLVDANFCAPGLARVIQLSAPRGWDDVVEENGIMDDALLHPTPRLAVLPLNSSPHSRMDRLSSSAAPEWLTRFRQDYSLIVLDGGSVWEGGTSWASAVDVALVVCDSDRTVADEWARAWDRLEEAGTHVMGIVETFT
jgi:Mrp family chromosome partitioning ATPase